MSTCSSARAVPNQTSPLHEAISLAINHAPRFETNSPLVLRTAAVWGTFVLSSRDLAPGQSLLVGEGPDALVAKPDQSPIADLPIRAVGRGWELDLRGVTGGALRLRGREEDALELSRSGAPLPIVAGDHGVLQYGSLSVFFQFAHPAPVPKSRFRIDFGLVLAFLFALLSVGGALMLLYMLFPSQELAKPIELTSPEELKIQYRVTPPEPDQAPGAEAGGAAGAKTKEPKPLAGSSKRRPGPKAADPERAAPAPGPPGPSSALTEVMQGEVGKEVMETLGTLSSVSEALGGLSSSGLVLGGQSGGLGLRASGGGGGQDGTALFGSGTLDTGFGSGAGVAGNGRGRAGSGTGVGGDGTGRGGERRLAAAAAPASGQGLSPAQISRVVRARERAFGACYETAAARDPKLQGGITISFTVSPSGSVTARVANSSLGNARVESCVLRIFNRLNFPAADKSTSANWPLVFRPGRQ